MMARQQCLYRVHGRFTFKRLRVGDVEQQRQGGRQPPAPQLLGRVLLVRGLLRYGALVVQNGAILRQHHTEGFD